MKRLGPMAGAVLLLQACEPSEESVHPLDQMEAVFVGNPSKDLIDKELTAILSAFSEVPNQRTKSNLGDMVFTLRKNSNVRSEMDILTCMSKASEAAVNANASIEYLAASCTTLLEVN